MKNRRSVIMVLLPLILAAAILMVIVALLLRPERPKHDEHSYRGATINGYGLVIEQDIPNGLDYENLEIVQPFDGMHFSCANSRCRFTVKRGDDGTVINPRAETAITDAIKAKRSLYVVASVGGYVVMQSMRPEQH